MCGVHSMRYAVCGIRIHVVCGSVRQSAQLCLAVQQCGRLCAAVRQCMRQCAAVQWCGSVPQSGSVRNFKKIQNIFV
jgi:hypothetical protein